MSERIYLASSWRNEYQSTVLHRLRERWEVYDFKNPAAGNSGFHWSAIDGGWEQWDTPAYVRALAHPVAVQGYKSDIDALDWCDTCVLLMPSGRSAALELGYAAGQGKRTAVLIMEKQEPELMLKMAEFITGDIDELCAWLGCR